MAVDVRRGTPPPVRWCDQYVNHDREVRPETLAYFYGVTRPTVMRWAKRLGILEMRWPPTPMRRDPRYPRGCRRRWSVIRSENLPRLHMLFLPELRTREALTLGGIDPGLFRSAPPRRRHAVRSKACLLSFSRRFITRSTASFVSPSAPSATPPPTPPSGPTTPPAS